MTYINNDLHKQLNIDDQYKSFSGSGIKDWTWHFYHVILNEMNIFIMEIIKSSTFGNIQYCDYG